MEKQPTDPRHFARLQEELIKATQASKEKIQQWEQFKTDYEALQSRLYSLPDKLTHDVMVPFGKFAFMPGQLYHTNEILVLLGDNWFTKRSVKQALEIAERRKQNVIKMLEEEQKQFSDYEARRSFAADFQTTVEGHEDTVEIKEDYHPGDKERWKKRKARTSKEGRVPPPRQVFPRQTDNASLRSPVEENRTSNVSGGPQGAKSDEEIWRRLDELEKEEEEAVMAAENGSCEDSMIVQNQPKKVSVQKSKKEEHLGEREEHKGTLRIAVKHTKLAKQLEETPTASEDTVEEEGKDKPKFRSPADIFHQPIASEKTVHDSRVAEEKPHSKPTEAKGVKWDPNLISFSDQKDTKEAKEEVAADVKPKRPPLMQPRPPMPFSGQVVERSTSSFPSQSQPTTPSKVSKFKASRQKK